MIARLLPFAFAAGLALAGCGPTAGVDGAPTEVSVIGDAPRIADPNRHLLTPPQAVLMGAVAQGLVTFDAEGSIEPGLAGRWIVPAEGMSYIFRLGDARWNTGARVKADIIARRLRAAISPGSRNPLKPVLGSIDEVIAVTDDVIDVRLKGPRPRFLELLAQPELAMVFNGATAGPLRYVQRERGGLLLVPMDEPLAADATTPLDPERRIILRGERAALAVARYASGGAALVLGGTFADLPIARVAGVRPRELHFDPARGLFGLAFAGDQPFLADPAIRAALSMSLDRPAIVAAFSIPGWEAIETITPPGLDDLKEPTRPAWGAAPIAERRAAAIAAIEGWRATHGPPPVLRVALPQGPGARILFARLAADWRGIGIETERVAADAPADLRLVDEVAPAEIASWYLRRFTCASAGPCAEEADTALLRAISSPDMGDRTARLAEADAALAGVTPFIPLASPPRWSLVARALDGFRPSPRARHPLTLLRAPPR
jgi:peptide/nickel transport system substrate-binding protein